MTHIPGLSEIESAQQVEPWIVTVEHLGEPARLLSTLAWSSAAMKMIAIRVVSARGPESKRGPWRVYDPDLLQQFLQRSGGSGIDDEVPVRIYGFPGLWCLFGQPSARVRVPLHVDVSKVRIPDDVPAPSWGSWCRQKGRVRAWRLGFLMGRMGFPLDANAYEPTHGSAAFYNAWNEGHAEGSAS